MGIKDEKGRPAGTAAFFHLIFIYKCVKKKTDRIKKEILTEEKEIDTWH